MTASTYLKLGYFMLYSWFNFCFNMVTLVYLIAEHARLTILGKFSTLLALIRSCSLNYFWLFFHPAPLLGSACLILWWLSLQPTLTGGANKGNYEIYVFCTYTYLYFEFNHDQWGVKKSLKSTLSSKAPQIIKTKKLKLKKQRHIIHHFNPWITQISNI